MTWNDLAKIIEQMPFEQREQGVYVSYPETIYEGRERSEVASVEKDDKDNPYLWCNT